MYLDRSFGNLFNIYYLIYASSILIFYNVVLSPETMGQSTFLII